MTRVLALMDDSPIAAEVRSIASTIARLIDAELDAVRVIEHGAPGGDDALRFVAGDPAETLAQELGAPDVEIGVIGARSIASKPELLGHVATSLVLRTLVPLVVVPPDARPLASERLTVVLPLDGDPSTSAAAVRVLRRLPRDLDDVVTVHVFDSTTVPMFLSSDQDQEIVAQDFLATHTGTLSSRAQLRLGRPSHEILDVARTEDADAILVCWGQDLTEGRAEVVRQLLAETTIPVILAPVASA